MAFFGPGGLSGATSTPGLDPELRKALLAQFPGLETLTQGAQQQGGPPRTLQSLGYQWPGPTLYAGQGTGAFQLSPFESASGVSPESITGGLAQGTFGKSSSQSPLGTPQQQGSSLLSLPSLSLPMAQVAATQGGYGESDMSGGAAPAEGGGITISAGDVLGAGEKIAGLFSPGTGTAFDPGQQTQTQGYQDYRAGERDLSTLGGSFMQNALSPAASLGSFLNPIDTSGMTFSAGAPEGFGALNYGATPTQTLAPGTTFEMPGAGPTSFAPGGSAQTALGGVAQPGMDWSSLLSGGNLMNAGGLLTGLYGLYSGVQAKDPQTSFLSALQAYQGLSPLINQMTGASTLPSVGEMGMQGLQAIAPDLAASLSGKLAGMTAAESTAALGELGINTATSGMDALVGNPNAAGVGALVSAGLQQLMAQGGSSAVDVQSAGRALAPILAGMSGATGGVAAVIAAIMDTYGEFQQTGELKSSGYNDPILAQLYSNATGGVSNANQLLGQYAGGYGQATTNQLMNDLSAATQSLLPYFQTGQGGVKALRPSGLLDTEGKQSSAEYTENFRQAQSQVNNLVKELFNRGLSYEQIGQIPAGLGWASQSLDAAGRPQEYYLRGKAGYEQTAPPRSEVLKSRQILTRGQNVDPSAPGYEAKTAWDDPDRYQPEYRIAAPEGLNPNEQGFSPHAGSFSYSPWAYAGAGTNGSPLDLGAFTPDNAFLAALGATGYDPNSMTPQEQAKGQMGLPDTGAMEGVASMYGGPMWQALARMGSNEFTPLIQQNFNPWATWSGMSPDQRLTAMGPSVLGPTQMNKDAGIYGSSWGQVENPRLADFFAGVTPDQLPATGFTPPTGRPPVDLQQLAQQEDPMLQQLQQYLQGMGGLNQSADPILQAIQQNLQGAPVGGVLPQTPGSAPGFTSTPGGGGIDLMALLRQLGYAQ